MLLFAYLSPDSKLKAIMESADEYIKHVVGYVYPPGVMFGDDQRLRKRIWIFRVRGMVPQQLELDVAARALLDDIVFALKHDKARASMDDACVWDSVGCSLLRCDDSHVIAELVFPEAGAMSDELLILTRRALLGIDDRWGVEDLQGIPKRFWLLYELSNRT